MLGLVQGEEGDREAGDDEVEQDGAVEAQAEGAPAEDGPEDEADAECRGHAGIEQRTCADDGGGKEGEFTAPGAILETRPKRGGVKQEGRHHEGAEGMGDDALRPLGP